MSCPEVWLKMRLVIKILFVSTIIAFCATVIGFATPVWISDRFNVNEYRTGQNGKTIASYVGIWQACGGEFSGCSNIDGDFKDYFIATRALACLGLIGAVITTILVFIYSYLLKGKTGSVLTGSMLLSFVTGILLTISLAIYGGELGKYYLSFSFAMMCIASILYTVNGVLCLVCLCFGTDAPPYVPHHADI